MSLIIKLTSESSPNTKSPKIKTTESTIPVCFIVLANDGQDTFLSSEKVSLIRLFLGGRLVLVCLDGFASFFATLLSSLLILLGFFVTRVLLAKSAIFLQFDSVGIIFLVLITIIISLFALGALKSNFRSHNFFSQKINTPVRMVQT